MKKENDYNIPNFLSILRIVLSPIIVLMIFLEIKMLWIVVVFAIAALTDAADGYIARHYNQKTELGRKLDMFADRILMISVVVGILYYMIVNSLLTQQMVIFITLILLREIIALPFLAIALLSKGNIFPQARKIAKLTTLLQGIAFPMILLGWNIAIYFVIPTAITGACSGVLYAYDSLKKKSKNTHKK